VNRKLILANLFLGLNSAGLIAEWIIRRQVDVNKLILK